MKSFLKLVLQVWVALLFLAPSSAPATTMYAALSGDPCCGIPDDQLKYLDANEACTQEVQLGPAGGCTTIFYATLRSDLGSQPTTASACVYDWQCHCGDCLIGTPEDPRNLHIATFAGKTAFPATKNCSGLALYLGICSNLTSKGKGCTATATGNTTTFGNPCDVATGSKFQRETIYRAGSGGLELVLSYNSKVGTSYFQSGPFGRQWTSPYFVRVRGTGQGIAAVERPDGRELEFRQPTSGNTYTADTDVTEKLERVLDSSQTQLLAWHLTSPDGDRFEEHSGPASLQRGNIGTLVRIRDRALVEQTMTYSTSSTPPSIAPMPGLLLAVTDHVGRQLTFTYDANFRVATMTDPGGGTYAFEYDGPSGPAGANNLTKVTFADGRTRVYFYAEVAQINGGAACATPSPALANALTGIQDENGARFATWSYDCDGRATSSERASGALRHTFAYAAGVRTVVDPLNTSRTLSLINVLGIGKVTGASQPAASGTGTSSNAFSYDANGNVASYTDYNGNRTNYSYDLARNLETSRTEGLTSTGGTTPQTRTITTQWHAAFRLPTSIAEPLRITRFVYDPDGTQCGARGAICSRSMEPTSDADGSQAFAAIPSGPQRVWTYTYNTNGDVLTVNGPRTDVADVTTYTYYANNDADPAKRGRVATITSAAGHVTSITSYNAHGQPLGMVDANGLPTTMTYDARQRLKTRTVGGELTSYDYDFVGNLTKVTLPDGSFLSYTYDEAHRLTGMQDNLGNRIAYMLDPMGNRTQEEVRDPANQLAQTRSRVFNNLNRLFRELGAQSQTTEYAYDDQGNVISVKDPLNRITSNQYDALNRLRQVTTPAPVSALTQYAYNGLDALTQVTDPRSLVTGYAVDGLGNLNVQTSPDTGTTSNTYDAAGNLLTQTDAKGQTTTYAYDALNRVTLITFHDGSKQTYAYDQGANGIGRLSSITETNPANQVTSTIAYGYDQHGRVTSEARTVAGVQYFLAYRYDGSGRLDQFTYPSGRTVNYAFDSLGRVNAVTTAKPGAQAQTVVSSVSYHPFGGVKGYTLGNGQTYTRGIDLDGRIASYTLASQSFAIGYDAASRIAFISNIGNPANTNTYGYDSLDRLTSAVLPTTPYAYNYDAVGNRTSRTAGSSTDNYAYGSTNNRIASITPASGPVRNFVFDANGSTTADGQNAYAYDVRGRMVQATSAIGATNYQVNALGQRIRKSNSLGDSVFHYDIQGRLIAESTPTGTLKRELIYLGDIPVGVVQ